VAVDYERTWLWWASRGIEGLSQWRCDAFAPKPVALRCLCPPEPPVLYGRPRLRTANRDLMVCRAAALDEIIPPDDPARAR
jgi:hypothetical protein